MRSNGPPAHSPPGGRDALARLHPRVGRPRSASGHRPRSLPDRAHARPGAASVAIALAGAHLGRSPPRPGRRSDRPAVRSTRLRAPGSTQRHHGRRRGAGAVVEKCRQVIPTPGADPDALEVIRGRRAVPPPRRVTSSTDRRRRRNPRALSSASRQPRPVRSPRIGAVSDYRASATRRASPPVGPPAGLRPRSVLGDVGVPLVERAAPHRDDGSGLPVAALCV